MLSVPNVADLCANGLHLAQILEGHAQLSTAAPRGLEGLGGAGKCHFEGNDGKVSVKQVYIFEKFQGLPVASRVKPLPATSIPAAPLQIQLPADAGRGTAQVLGSLTEAPGSWLRPGPALTVAATYEVTSRWKISLFLSLSLTLLFK